MLTYGGGCSLGCCLQLNIQERVNSVVSSLSSSPRSFPGDPTETDYTAVGCAITTISSNLTEMSKGVKLLAALMEKEVGSGQNLMGAARALAGAVTDLLRSVEPAAAEVRGAGAAAA